MGFAQIDNNDNSCDLLHIGNTVLLLNLTSYDA
jgi:hypothetical protein